MNNTSFEFLLDKYLTGSLTEPERQLFSEMLNDPSRQKQLEEIIGKELAERAYEGQEDSKILASIQAKIQHRISSDRKPGKTISFYMQRFAVAAVFILLVGFGAYWLLADRNTVTPKELASENKKAADNSLQPGGNRAVLKLADGTEILLDSAHTGTLAQQGQVKVIKLTDGQLSYSSSEGKSSEILYNTITTPKGGQYQLVLEDGSKVWLNAASVLRFPAFFGGKGRTVELAGEGYFEIAKSNIPFHVKLNDLDVQVVGTHFNVNGYTDEAATRTTLLEGSVKVTKGVQNTLLKPRQQAAVSNKGNISIVDDVDVEKVVAWKNGFFHFKNTDIKTILREASRWYDVEFKYEDEIDETFSGQISRNVNASQLLKILELTGKVHFVIQGKTIIVKG